MRIGFAGTPEFAAQILVGLIQGGYVPAVVYTRRDKPQGRGRKLTPSPVKVIAQEHNLPVEQPAGLRKRQNQQVLHDYHLDLFIVAAYGLILPLEVLNAPVHGCLNVHASLLPRWRGAAPIERAILAGDEKTGVSLMQMDEGLDTGAVYSSLSMPISASTTGAQLSADLANLGIEALLDLLPKLPEADVVPQDEALANYAHKLTNADRPLEFSRSAAELERQVRALTDREPATCQRDDISVQVLAASTKAATDQVATNQVAPGTIIAAHKKAIEIATGNGTLCVQRLKINRGKGSAMGPADLLNGYREHFTPGDRFH